MSECGKYWYYLSVRLIAGPDTSRASCRCNKRGLVSRTQTKAPKQPYLWRLQAARDFPP